MYKVINLNIENTELARGGIIHINPFKMFNLEGMEFKLDTDERYRKAAAATWENDNSIIPIEGTYWKCGYDSIIPIEGTYWKCGYESLPRFIKIINANDNLTFIAYKNDRRDDLRTSSGWSPSVFLKQYKWWPA